MVAEVYMLSTYLWKCRGFSYMPFPGCELQWTLVLHCNSNLYTSLIWFLKKQYKDIFSPTECLESTKDFSSFVLFSLDKQPKSSEAQSKIILNFTCQKIRLNIT